MPSKKNFLRTANLPIRREQPSDEECSRLDRRHTNSKVPEDTKEDKC